MISTVSFLQGNMLSLNYLNSMHGGKFQRHAGAVTRLENFNFIALTLMSISISFSETKATSIHNSCKPDDSITKFTHLIIFISGSLISLQN